VQRQFLARNLLEELLEEPVVQLHLEMLAWLGRWLVLLRQGSQKLVTVVSTTPFCWLSSILTCLQTMSPTKMIGKRVEFRISDKSISQANHDLIPTPRHLRHPVRRYEDVERVMRRCIWVTRSGRSAKININIKRRATRLIGGRVLVDTKNDKAYSLSSKPPSSPLDYGLVP